MLVVGFGIGFALVDSLVVEVFVLDSDCFHASVVTWVDKEGFR